MIRIDKQLKRPDGGTLSAGSIIDFKIIRNDEDFIVRYNLIHWYNEAAKSDDDLLPVVGVTNFSYKLIKDCTEAEYAQLDEEGSADLVELWLKELIDAKIGDGYTKII